MALGEGAGQDQGWMQRVNTNQLGGGVMQPRVRQGWGEYQGWGGQESG